MGRIADRATAHASIEINRLQTSFKPEQQIADLPVEAPSKPATKPVELMVCMPAAVTAGAPNEPK